LEIQAMKLRLRVWTLLLLVGLFAGLVSLVVRENQKVFAPDIISVEFSSALPGRPITGTRLVMPDGMMSLGYYGRIPVKGLTAWEIRRAVAVHLRQFFPGDTLGGITVKVVKVNSRRPNLIDWMSGEVRLKDVKTFL
jgi:hypothetical protein